jgi:hypothetical protein
MDSKAVVRDAAGRCEDTGLQAARPASGRARPTTPGRKDRMSGMPTPAGRDVVVRLHATQGYVLGRPDAPPQFTLTRRAEAVSRAVAFAKHQRVRAWFLDASGDLIVLGDDCR